MNMMIMVKIKNADAMTGNHHPCVMTPQTIIGMVRRKRKNNLLRNVNSEEPSSCSTDHCFQMLLCLHKNKEDLGSF